MKTKPKSSESCSNFRIGAIGSVPGNAHVTSRSAVKSSTDWSNPAAEKVRVLSCFLFRYNEQLIIKDYLDTLVALKSVGDVIQEWLLFTGWALPLLTRKWLKNSGKGIQGKLNSIEIKNLPLLTPKRMNNSGMESERIRKDQKEFFKAKLRMSQL